VQKRHAKKKEVQSFRVRVSFSIDYILKASTIMSSGSKILSTKGEVLNFNTRADIEPWLKDIDPTIIEEVHFGRSTISVEAANALGEFLRKTTVLKVSVWWNNYLYTIH
jgi:hypothetical protein